MCAWRRPILDRRPGAPLRVVNDQRLYAELRGARGPRDRLSRGHDGLRDVSRGERRRDDLARVAEEILRRAGSVVRVEAITTAKYGAVCPAPRLQRSRHRQVPLAGRMPAMPSWKEALGEYLAERL